jgi:hypothetical protein
MVEVVTDKAGRRITLRKVGVLETLRLYKALGPELSNNTAYVGVACIAIAAAAIDELPVPFPASEAALEALLDRVGDDGMAALIDAVTPPVIATVVADAGN